ncbi:MAG TPA: hypothetical protein VIY49_20550 [Bryobacteraceae bacterium]
MKRFLLCVSALAAVSCVFHRVEVKQVVPSDGVVVSSPVKAHLKDGSTVVYAKGVTVAGGALQGAGVRYDFALKQPVNVTSIPLDSVVGMESFQTKVNVAPTVLVNTLITAGAIAGGVALFKAIFGSCPTVYSNDGAVEEAELFSNSIAPLFESRDVGRLQAQPDANGMLSLDVRNEAMETHYINHLQLFEVQHAADEFVLPDVQGHPVAVRGIRTPADIAARNGQGLSAILGAADGLFYQTEQHRIEGASASDLNDWIDLTAPVPEGADSTTLVFRLRNSLLETTLLYDVMLAPAGARSIDWLGAGLGHVSAAVEMGRWYERLAGLHVSVFRDGAYREVARLPDSGPIFWHDVAAVIPAERGETSLRVRLSFLADQWRIDRVGVASAARPAEPRVIPISEVRGSRGLRENEALESLSAPDDRYLQTGPGDRFFAGFNVGTAPPSQSRTFLLSSQGYYTEWIRGTWIQTASAKEPFVPNDQAVLAALQQWAAKRESFEERFVKDRVPVR